MPSAQSAWKNTESGGIMDDASRLTVILTALGEGIITPQMDARITVRDRDEKPHTEISARMGGTNLLSTGGYLGRVYKAFGTAAVRPSVCIRDGVFRARIILDGMPDVWVRKLNPC